MMAECAYWKILSAAELGRMLRHGLGRVGFFLMLTFVSVCCVSSILDSSFLLGNKLQEVQTGEVGPVCLYLGVFVWFFCISTFCRV